MWDLLRLFPKLGVPFVCTPQTHRQGQSGVYPGHKEEREGLDAEDLGLATPSCNPACAPACARLVLVPVRVPPVPVHLHAPVTLPVPVLEPVLLPGALQRSLGVPSRCSCSCCSGCSCCFQHCCSHCCRRTGGKALCNNGAHVLGAPRACVSLGSPYALRTETRRSTAPDMATLLRRASYE